ncbi:MAG: hypothetical protein AAB784_00010 [Patescibacteria group bacterium]
MKLLVEFPIDRFGHMINSGFITEEGIAKKISDILIHSLAGLAADVKVFHVPEPKTRHEDFKVSVEDGRIS